MSMTFIGSITNGIFTGAHTNLNKLISEFSIMLLLTAVENDTVGMRGSPFYLKQKLTLQNDNKIQIKHHERKFYKPMFFVIILSPDFRFLFLMKCLGT